MRARMFLKFHGSILSEIVLITICLEQKGLKPPIKKLYNLVFKLEEATRRKSQENKKENRTHPILLGVFRIIGDTPQFTSFG